MKCFLSCLTAAFFLCSCRGATENPEPSVSVQAQPASSEPVAQSVATDPTQDIKSCSNIPGYNTELELRPIPSQKTNMLFVTFVGKHPAAIEIDKILRACLSTASNLDSKWPIVGNAFLRATPSSDPDDDTNINVYEGLEYISFDPTDKTIAVRKMTFGK